MNNVNQNKKRTLIIGAGEASELLIPYFQTHKGNSLISIGILDDREDFLELLGVPILGKLRDLEKVVREYLIEHIIFAIPSLQKNIKIDILEMCAQIGVQTEIMPDIAAIVSGEGSIQTMQKLEYADLLGREEAQLDYGALALEFHKKRVLITGAGGSIGGELVRQLAKCEPAEILLLGHGENSIFNIHQEMRMITQIPLVPLIADIQDKGRLQTIFDNYKPDIVYHAAAHKHVPMMEYNIGEAIKNNIIGTQNLVDISAQYGVERFVMISTDKTVEPTSVMGASKKVAEWIVQSKNNDDKTGVYSVVRFGNVLGSRGSAIPLFWKQIKMNKPVTITHPDMERYFMTIPEASQLVIEASVLAKGGEIFVLKMGKPQKIVNIVQKLAILAGKKHDNVQVKFIGIRDGEKIKEELFEVSEFTTGNNSLNKFYCGTVNIPKAISDIKDWQKYFSQITESDLRIQLFDLINKE
ncbi:polysaccharide biosynthesis protein [Listeria grandensis]|uniref:Polysaccharide biosynthesis protein n=1 Tax=Listeria grandensis TaxID=1494963 RepID=A0A7X1CPI5_9LIST|nr:nucleoside-diphosphate sugar epimerase/dehydratase [Listeria grandensis]MBC1474446.1 polysaccharide biosynthesis protein [Listeria grandensis]MBC1935992.1 polysaccharide biosynthesis protein [Listeria grandensis]